MSKAPKKASPDSQAEQKPQRSVLSAAWAALETGDVVTARALALAVLGGKTGPDDAAVARKLSKELSASDAAVGDLPEDVANAIITRTVVPARPYVYVVICAVVFVVLVGLARARYLAP